ncbi:MULTISPECIES: TolC family protein [unclassified Moraxella]|uniref:TolC family protein n=1 Tax=unclassified Moraxella TaxID=2685852 RepID=UPI003AF5F957
MMKKSHLFKVCVALSLYLSQSSHAQDLFDLYQTAQRTNANWAGQQYDYLANQKNLDFAKGDLFPQVGLQGSVKRNHFYPSDDATPDAGNGVAQLGIGFRQALWRADKWATYEKAQLADQANDLQLLQQHQQLTEQVIKAYLGALQAEAMTDSLNAEYTAIKAQDAMMQARLQQGVVARVDTEETRARLESVRALLANNEIAITTAKQQLSLLTGQAVDKLDSLAQPFNSELVSSKSIDDWLRLAQQQNLDIQLAQTKLAIANKQVDFLKSNLYPRVDFVGNVGWQNNTNDSPMNADGTNYSLGVELEMPLYTGGRTLKGLQQGTLQAQADESRLRFAYQAVMTQTSQAYLKLMGQKATITAQQTAVQANAKVAQASKVGYDLGVRSMVDTLLAERQYHASQRELINAYFEYLNAYVDLQKATGTLGEDTVRKIDGLLVN